MSFVRINEEDHTMIKRWTIWVAGFLCIMGLIWMACELPSQPEYGPDNPDPNPASRQAATITGIDPAEGYLQQEVTISGTGFDSTPDFNFVAFGQKTARVVAASDTHLTVITPNIAGETVTVRVAVKGSVAWSNEVDFLFKEALNIIADDINWPMGVEADDDGNVYVGSASDEVIYRIAPDGTRSEFAGVPVSGAIGWGPGNYLYAALSWEGKVVRISPDGSTVEDVVEAEGVVDFDWDASGNMFLLQNWGMGISMFDGSEVTQVFESEDELKSCRIFGDNLYVTAIWSSSIIRFPITAGALGDGEVVYEGDSPVGLEFDSEGTMYFTEAWETSLYTIKQDGTEETLFEEQLMTPMRYLTFHGKLLYIVYPGWADIGEVMSVYIGIEQAPNYGLQ
jgi:sugar lactone lactonase YvrE